ncbi:winged helix-turn-helix transcriptional regulator [Plantactinospora sonchi]|uniref:Helix-turn-helix domain-containing protein n=1 Tax=Plantactinospora sonchi TaxID=1544735 RepID=A0ABU7RZL0_9ACTN
MTAYCHAVVPPVLLIAQHGWSTIVDLHSAGDAVQLLSCKGTLEVIDKLVDGPKRHNELARVLGIDHKPLDRTLRRLQAARLVVREVQPVPLRVSYRLAPEAIPLLPVLNALATAWHALGRCRSAGEGRPRPNGNGHAPADGLTQLARGSRG